MATKSLVKLSKVIVYIPEDFRDAWFSRQTLKTKCIGNDQKDQLLDFSLNFRHKKAVHFWENGFVANAIWLD